MLSLDQAYARLAELISKGRPLHREMVMTVRAVGRVLADQIKALAPHPMFDQAAMDGVALTHTQGQSDYVLRGTIAAGDTPAIDPLPRNACVRIMTGAPLPPGADTVVAVELLEEIEGGIRIPSTTVRGQHVRTQGSHVEIGAEIASGGTLLSANHVAALCAQGIDRVSVFARPKVRVAATGNEIVAAHMSLNPGQVYNSNSTAVTALVQDVADTEDLGVLPDDPSVLRDVLARLVDSDLIILSGGVSAGDFDYVPRAACDAGFEEIFHKVAIKPGKPVWLGRHRDGRLLFGLPGNPVSAIVVAQLLVLPLLRGLVTGSLAEPRWIQLPLSRETYVRGNRLTFRGGRLDQGAVDLVDAVGSGDVVGFASSRVLVRLLPNRGYSAGSMVDVWWHDTW